MKCSLLLGTVAAIARVVLGKNAGPLADCTKAPLKSNGVCDTSKSPPERAAALVAAMQIDEKLANLVSKSPGVSRLGLPNYNWWNEALHGVAGAPGIDFDGDFKTATSFPMPILMAAAFDDELIENVATSIGAEARAFGNTGHSGLDYWTPNVNPFRDPRWGRGSETPGEDIARVNGYTAGFIRGLEGNHTQRRIMATCKHYAGYDLEAADGVTRHSFNAKITPQDLAEYYMPPFRVCTRDLNAGSLMCSYNAVNGVPACASKYLLQTILRDHWNWTAHNNYVTSDCEAVADVSSGHHYATSLAEGTADCFNAGMDNSCEYSGSSDIPGAWSSKALNESTVDRALLRLYEGLVRAGYFDGSAAEYASVSLSSVNTETAQKLALQTVTDGVVMLKNDGTLPLKLGPGSKVAMVGFWADDKTKLRGGYSGPPPYLITPVAAAKNMNLSVITASGTSTDAIASAASKADFVLYFGGLDTSSAGEQLDRTSLAWPSAQASLIKTLSGLGKPLVVIQMGDQVDNSPILENKGVNSILWASWPGQEGGSGIMQLISGVKAPAGRLPVSQYPASYTSVPMTDMSLRPGGSNPGRTYMWYPSLVQPFGTGLHYTTFEPTFGNFSKTIAIADLMAGCKARYLDTCPLPPFYVNVKNTGNATSDYVVLIFVGGKIGPAPYPIKRLATYTRLRGIAAGRTASVQLSWSLSNLARHDSKGNMVLYPGKYTLMLDQPTLTTTTLELTGNAIVLDEWPAET